MEAALFIWFANSVNNLSVVLLVFTMISAFVVLVYYMSYAYSGYVNWKNCNKKFMFIPIVLGILTAITPSERTMYMMAAGYFGQTIVQSEQASEVGNKMMNIINGKLDEYINEMSSSKEASK